MLVVCRWFVGARSGFAVDEGYLPQQGFRGLFRGRTARLHEHRLEPDQIRRQAFSRQAVKSQSAGLAIGSLAQLAAHARLKQPRKPRSGAGQRWRPRRIDGCSGLALHN